MARVYFGNLDPDVQKDELDDTCNKFGRVSDIWIARNPPGFAFVVGHPFPTPAQLSPSAHTLVLLPTAQTHPCILAQTFEDQRDADDCVRGMNGQKIGNSSVRVELGRNRGDGRTALPPPTHHCVRAFA